MIAEIKLHAYDLSEVEPMLYPMGLVSEAALKKWEQDNPELRARHLAKENTS